MSHQDNNIVSTDWLSSHLNDPSLVVLDATYHLPDVQRDAYAEYQAGHIPGARFFDIDDVCDPLTGLPHMLPSNALMSEKMSALGIGDQHHVVVYDSYGLFSAARVWWMLRSFSHQGVSVLDGGLPKWANEQRLLTSEVPTAQAAVFNAKLDESAVRSLQAMLGNISQPQSQVIDARGAGRFSGSEPEVREGLRSGHIPGSKNLPYSGLVNPDDKTLLAPEVLRELFESISVDVSQPITTTCGSGVTACVLALALAQIDASDVSVYDGSWVEWGANPKVPIETGSA